MIFTCFWQIVSIQTQHAKAFTTTHVHNYPLIFAGRAVQKPKAQLDGTTPYQSKKNPEATEHKGDLLIHDLYQNMIDSVQEIRAVDTDTKYYLANTPEKCLQEA